MRQSWFCGVTGLLSSHFRWSVVGCSVYTLYYCQYYESKTVQIVNCNQTVNFYHTLRCSNRVPRVLLVCMLL
jgi:hypothetical protein